MHESSQGVVYLWRLYVRDAVCEQHQDGGTSVTCGGTVLEHVEALAQPIPQVCAPLVDMLTRVRSGKVDFVQTHTHKHAHVHPYTPRHTHTHTHTRATQKGKPRSNLWAELVACMLGAVLAGLGHGQELEERGCVARVGHHTEAVLLVERVRDGLHPMFDDVQQRPTNY